MTVNRFVNDDEQKGYFHSTTLMLNLRIGLDVVRQNSDLDARMLKDAPPCLAAFGRRLVAEAAAALPAMVAAASAVAQPELSGCRQAALSSLPSPVRSVAGDFCSAAAAVPLSNERSGEMTTNELGSSCFCGDDGGSPQRSSTSGDDVSGIGETSSGRGSSVTLTSAMDVARLSSSTVRLACSGSRGADDDDEEDALGVGRRSVAMSSTSLKA